MATTKANLDIQSDKVVTEPRLQTRVNLKDVAAVNSLFIDWDEPAGADRTVTLEDPGADDTVAYLDAAQTFQNKKITTVPAAVDDIANKAYVDAAVIGGVPDATSASGGGTKGKVTFDSDKGLSVTAGVAEVKVDATSIDFNGSGELEFIGTIADATSAPGGGTKGKVTFDSNKGFQVIAGVGEVKVDTTTIQFNGSGQLETVGGGTSPIATADVAIRSPFTRDITAVTAPSMITLGTDIDALSYPDGSTTGQRFDFTIPDDYFAGTLQLLATYKMSTAVASPNNIIRVSTQAEIVDVSAGVIDSASYPETQQNFVVPDNSTNFTRQLLLAVADGDFGRGDSITFYVKRFGAHANDTHTGAWQVVSYEIRYESVLGTRIAVGPIEFLSDAAGETPPAAGTIGTDIDVLDFPPATDAAQKISFLVPDNWDEQTDCNIVLNYAMSTASGAVVRLETSGEQVDVMGGSITAVALVNLDHSTTSDTDPHRVVVRSIPASDLVKGSVVVLKIARRGAAVQDTHAGNFRLIGLFVSFGVAPSSGVSAVTITENYLESFATDLVGGTIAASVLYPDFATTFDKLIEISSSSGGAQLDVAFPGRLASAQTDIAQLKINIVGAGASPQYALKIYAEGSGATPVYDSGVVAAPGVLTEITVLAGSLSAQPTGQKKYHIVVEGHLDAGESVSISSPFVRQE